MVITNLYGRHLGDFELGSTYAHPWEVTVDEGTIALFQAAFLDACPVFASRSYPRALGLRDRPLHPILLLNLALSFSVHDVSEQCIAHLSYDRVGFPRAVYPGATLHARSTCLGLKRVPDAERGVVHVRTGLFDEDEQLVCWLERKAMLRTGTLGERPRDPYPAAEAVREQAFPSLPPELHSLPHPPVRNYGCAGFFEDFDAAQIYCHQVGKTVSEGEHHLLTSLVRNTHPLHFDAHYAATGGSFTGKPVVMGGLVLAWAVSLASRDISGNALWELGLEDGSHAAPVHAGDTLYAATQVLGSEIVDERYGRVRTRLVAVKNTKPDVLLAMGKELFRPERDKPKSERLADKVLEITRTLLVRRRPTA